MHNHLKGLYAPKYAPKAKQPLSNKAKWLLINERETRFELATLSLGSYGRYVINSWRRLLKMPLNAFNRAFILLLVIVSIRLSISFV